MLKYEFSGNRRDGVLDDTGEQSGDGSEVTNVDFVNKGTTKQEGNKSNKSRNTIGKSKGKRDAKNMRKNNTSKLGL